ncbi:MAG TPA: ATP-binding protein [Vicinamibacterales bacterium]|jgi:signal transduction histidine kinase
MMAIVSAPPTPPPPSIARRTGRIAAVGGLVAVLVLAAGFGIIRWRFGATPADARARIEREARARVAEMIDRLQASAGALASRANALTSIDRDPNEARALFEAAAAALPAVDREQFGLTLYDAAGQPVAWSGRSADTVAARVSGPAALFVAPGALGPRLVDTRPLLVQAGTTSRRVGTVVAERLLTPAEPVGSPTSGAFVLDTAIVPVRLRAPYEGAGAGRTPNVFLVSAPDGSPLLEATIDPAALAAARSHWWRAVFAIALCIVALTLLLCGGPLLDWRDRTDRFSSYARALGCLAAFAVGARAIAWWAFPAAWRGDPILSGGSRLGAMAALLRSPLDLLLTGILLATLAALLFDAVERWRVAVAARHRLLAPGLLSGSLVAGGYLFASGAVIALVLGYEAFLRTVVAALAPDPLHFSLTTLNGRQVTIAVGLIFLDVAVVWAGTLLLRTVAESWRFRRRWLPRLLLAICWAIPVVAAILAGPLRLAPAGLPALLVVAGCAALALCTPPAVRWYRRTSQAAGFALVLLALLVPPLLLYPSLIGWANRAREQQIQTRFGPEAADLRDTLKQQLRESLNEIDALTWLPDLVAATHAAGPQAAPSTESAYNVWLQTDLARARSTSAVELYGPNGALVSRFALNLPEYAAASRPWRPDRCEWDLFEEVSPFGSSERRILHAGRALCEPDGHGGRKEVGAIVVHLMLDYDTLPFISSHNPYFELLRTDRSSSIDENGTRDLQFVLYGWSQSAIYTSGQAVWQLPASIFDRLVASRAPFWASLTQNGSAWRVYFLSDRSGIYALGYPAITATGHILNLAQLALLVTLLYALLLLARAIAGWFVRRQPASGRRLLREIRASFYRRLFWAFVAAAVVPVVILALATRAYMAGQLRTGIESAATRTVAVAQHVIDDYLTLQQRGSAPVPVLDDDVLVWIGRVIDQDVNVFEQSRLLATSERDLFASGVLPSRTPANVYRAVALQHLPTFVGEETIGAFRYLVAAAPVRIRGGRGGIVTVPLTLRQQEIEEQIDEIDRRVFFSIVLFSLLGAGIGYLLAEGIADPVKRLSRATRRIARGDLDARVAATTADELGRLVQDFNHMAADLKRQRLELERTQRVAAWADMARQVAHDIKNPLTPIQLSAEHLRRVHADRGRPLGPVFDECLSTILQQVALLREIAGEFSNFASSPAAQPVPTSLADLITEIVEPYRLGLADRIAITIEVPPTLPVLWLDRLLMSRALANLIENAVSAIPASGHLRVSAALDPEGTWVQLQIEDDGVGMDEESLRRAFDPYFSTKKTGTGLGMTIARRNVEANGGAIAIASARGQGTKVTIRLPVAAAARSL